MALTSNQKVGIGFALWFGIGLVGFTWHGHYTLFDSLYLMSQIITTVGYGDLTPDTEKGYLFLSFFVLISVLLLSGCAGSLMSNFVSSQQDVVRRQIDSLLQRAFGEDADNDGVPDFMEKGKKGLARRFCEWYIKKPKVRAVVRAFLVWFGCVLLGMVFFSNYPGEDKTAIEAFYMGVITLSTVGYGDKTPITQAGKAFATVWMLVGSAALADLVSKFTIAFVDDCEEDSFGPKKLSAPVLDTIFDDEDVKQSVKSRVELLGDLAGTVSTPEGVTFDRILHRTDFIVFVLKDMGIVDKETIDKINRNFDMLDKNRSGYLDDGDVRAATKRLRASASYEPPQA